MAQDGFPSQETADKITLRILSKKTLVGATVTDLSPTDGSHPSRRRPRKVKSLTRAIPHALNDFELSAQGLQNRAVASIEAEFQRAQPSASTVWRATFWCHDVSLSSSGDTCAAVLALRQALQTARPREDLDAKLHEAEKEITRFIRNIDF
jgi:hypothetical protein